jgi:hypothetical protein
VNRRRLAWLAVLALALAGAGCGNDQIQPTGLSKLGEPISLINFTSSNGDVSFGHPSTWSVLGGTLPKVAQLSSGTAVATVFAYPRTDLPEDRAGAEASRGRLIASLKERDPSFDVEASRIRKVDGAVAVEIDGTGRIAGQRVRTKSIHVYKGAAEYVIDAYAKPETFKDADTEAFEPMLATIRLGGFPEGHVSGGVQAPG